jgi:hypothetical protein
MRDEEMNAGLDGADREMEAALASLAPVAASGRDALMYEAGARSARRLSRRSVWQWRAAAAMLGLATGLSILLRPSAQPPRIVVVPQEPTHATVSAAPPADVIISPFTIASLSATVLEEGIDAMPSVQRSRGAKPQQPVPSLRINHDLDSNSGDPS